MDTSNISPNRRKVIKAGMYAGLSGFALAVRPADSQELVITDKKGLVEGMVEVGEDKIAAYRAYPESGAKDAPVIVIVQEIFGVHEHLRDIVRRFAKLGYYAISMQYYQRIGDPLEVVEISAIIKTIVAKVPDDQVMKDTDDAFAFAAQEGASATRRAITGFCWGGRIVWLYAAHSAALKCGVAFYGRLIDKNATPNPLQPHYPIDIVDQLKAPVQGLYGQEDHGIPVADVKKMQKALTTANSPSNIHLYPEATHGFFADYRSSYHYEAAEDAWVKTQDWLKKHGV